MSNWHMLLGIVALTAQGLAPKGNQHGVQKNVGA